MTAPIQYPFESLTRFSAWQFSSDTGTPPHSNDRGMYITEPNTNNYLSVDANYYLTGSHFFVHLSRPINFGEELRFHFVGADRELDFSVLYDTIDIVGHDTVTTDENGMWYGAWGDPDGTLHIRSSVDGITWKEEAVLDAGP